MIQKALQKKKEEEDISCRLNNGKNNVVHAYVIFHLVDDVSTKILSAVTGVTWWNLK